MIAGAALAPLPFVIPLLGATLIAALKPILSHRAANVIAIAATAPNVAMSAFLLNASRSGTIVYWLGGWTPRNGIALGISFAVDPPGAGLCLLCAVLMLAALVFSSRYFDPTECLYQVLMLTFLAAMSGFSLSGDAFNMFVFFELMSAAAFALCGYKTEERESLQGACNFAVTNTIGAFLTLDGIALLYARTGALNLAQMGQALHNRSDALVIVAFVFLSAGFLIKAAVVPFHLWLADAHAIAPTPVCVLFSGIMVELGLYGVARFYWAVFAQALVSSTRQVQLVFLVTGALTAALGGVMCFSQRHLKRLLAFSTISHMGVLLMGFGLMKPDALGAFWIYLAGHSLAKSALFLAAGILLHRFETVDELELKGRGRNFPGLGFLFAGGGLALAGLPPFATFFGTLQMQQISRSAGFAWVPLFAFIAAILTGGAVFRSAGRIFLGMGRGAHGARKHDKDDAEKPGPVSKAMTVPPWILLILALLIAVPARFRDGAAQYSAQFQDTQAYAQRVLYGAPMPPAKAAAASISLRSIGEGVLPTAAALILAWLALAEPLRKFKRAAAIRPARLMLYSLRSLHSGVIGDYVVWIMTGVVIIASVLLVGHPR